MSEKIRPKMLQAALFIHGGYSVNDTALNLRVRPETVTRWKKHPDFIKEYELLQSKTRDNLKTVMYHAISRAFRDIDKYSDQFSGEAQYENALKLLKVLRIDQVYIRNPY